MSSEQLEAERKLFVAAFPHLDLRDHLNEGLAAFVDPKTQGAWEGWQAARSQPAIDDLLPRFKTACRALFRDRSRYFEDLETMIDVAKALESIQPAVPMVVSSETMTALREGLFIAPDNRRQIIAALESIAPTQSDLNAEYTRGRSDGWDAAMARPAQPSVPVVSKEDLKFLRRRFVRIMNPRGRRDKRCVLWMENLIAAHDGKENGNG